MKNKKIIYGLLVVSFIFAIAYVWFYHAASSSSGTDVSSSQTSHSPPHTSGLQINLQQLIKFTKAGDPKKFLLTGWSTQEENHLWTDSSEASLKIILQDAQNKNLILRMDANAYLGGGLTHQQVNVVINGQKVTSWEMTGRKWYEAQIPASITGDGLLNISFQISNPTAPCEVSDSKDCRKLGMAARELIIQEQNVL
ncbi:hypothetical protein LJC24_00710 [Desulfococcaceae bacterium OttesenSCG-928-F15]|nr:hypothetical protein [Desulfococcaceae bacterium OttesenSCG-928-F15]